MTRSEALWALVAGLFFGAGLVVSGMTDPHRVRAFLDVAHWDPTLMFVMGGAILSHAPVAWLVRRRGKAALGPLHLPTAKSVDARLVIGSALFGIGWGISGYCPGPAVLSLLSLSFGAVLFVGALLVGSRVETGLDRPSK